MFVVFFRLNDVYRLTRVHRAPVAANRLAADHHVVRHRVPCPVAGRQRRRRLGGGAGPVHAAVWPAMAGQRGRSGLMAVPERRHLVVGGRPAVRQGHADNDGGEQRDDTPPPPRGRHAHDSSPFSHALGPHRFYPFTRWYSTITYRNDVSRPTSCDPSRCGRTLADEGHTGRPDRRRTAVRADPARRRAGVLLGRSTRMWRARPGSTRVASRRTASPVPLVV
jgi:hypothetical protein